MRGHSHHIAVLFAAFAAPAAVGQDLTLKAPPQQAPIVILGATLHPGDGGTIENGVVWFEAGVIRGVGASETEAGAPAGAQRIDGSGRHLWPGMIAAVTQVGLNEIGSISATQDYREVGDVSPEVYAAIAVNPDATNIPVTRSNGVLTVGVFPSGGLVPGRPSVMRLEGWTTEDMTVLADAGLVVDWPSLPSRRGRQSAKEHTEAVDRALERRADLDAAFRDARAWLAARQADPNVATDVRFEAMQPVLEGRRPVFLQANGVEAIRSGIGWALEQELRPVLVGGEEADLCLELLKENDVPVVVMGTHRLPGRRDDPFDRPFRLPAVLHEAGVAFCISGDGGYSNERNLPYHAATAVAHGLPLDAAFRAVTAGAAEILGVGDVLGTIEVGKAATLVLTDGHPLEITTHVQAAWIDGRRTDLSNKQTELAEKYRQKYRQLGLWPDGR